MLLLEPTAAVDDLRADAPSRRQREKFADYCHQYQEEVLSLPPDQLGRILAYLVRGLEHCHLGPEVFHTIIERELREQDFELSGKVARLVVLAALAESLEQRGLKLTRRTQSLVQICRGLIPVVLQAALRDHVGQ